MEVKYTTAFLNKLEDIFTESEYFLRYEKGNFKSGYCILKDKKVMVVTTYFSLEGKVNCLIDILRQILIDENKLSEKTKQFYLTLSEKTRQ
jgi:hypothetical protein